MLCFSLLRPDAELPEEVANAVADVMADKYGKTKSQILDTVSFLLPSVVLREKLVEVKKRD